MRCETSICSSGSTIFSIYFPVVYWHSSFVWRSVQLVIESQHRYCLGQVHFLLNPHLALAFLPFLLPSTLSFFFYCFAFLWRTYISRSRVLWSHCFPFSVVCVRIWELFVFFINLGYALNGFAMEIHDWYNITRRTSVGTWASRWVYCWGLGTSALSLINSEADMLLIRCNEEVE